ncbi:MAG: ribosome small subunit-dependent GTPase A [Rikenellaceae bacterium]|jgi:ribosome biogenesis GTPase|nr:ribosome small subunit-dependent GTPase A [Rikenellaceae bacterium]
MDEGLVIKNTGSWYQVEDAKSHQTILCKLKGAFRLKEGATTNPVAVGDRVDYQTEPDGTGVIAKIYPRKNYIIRRSSNLSRQAHVIAANLDQAFLLVTLDFPQTRLEFVDRFLVTAEAYNVPMSIILNKNDLYTEAYAPALADFLHTYALAGYPVYRVSARTGEGIDTLRELLQGRITLFSGNSGVGKSTLIHAVDPTLNPRSGEISAVHNRGKHTTTFSEMFPLVEGGYIIDTPGIKGFGLVDLKKEEVGRYFPEIFRYAPDCQYYNCTHTHEPGCAVQQAVAEGEIGRSRYVSYLKVLDDEDSKYRKGDF